MGFQQGLSGLDAASSLLSNIGNNISNANTVGFKSSETQFSDLFAASLGGSSNTQSGIGTQVSAVVQQFSQGNIVATSNPLDMAINGLGFFRMESTNGSISYTRDGQFQLNNQGVVVNAAGLQLTGYPVDASGNISSVKPQPLAVPTTSLAPSATTNITSGINLPSNDSVTNTSTTSVSPPAASGSTNPLNLSYNESTSVNFYDSLGNSHVLTMYFALDPSTTDASGNVTPTTIPSGLFSANTYLPSQAWTVYATVDNTEIPAGSGTGAKPGGVLGTVAFDGSGNLVYPAVDSSGNTLNVTHDPSGNLIYQDASGNTIASGFTLGKITSPTLSFSNGANKQILNFNFADTSEYGNIFTVNNVSADGFTSGELTGFTTSAKGIFQGQYSNGQSRTLGQLVLANFTDPQGLQQSGGGTWVQTNKSGSPLLGVPGAGNLGTIQSSAVESSNVDLTTELVNMLTAQRFYQANAQAIQTQNTVEQTIINLR